MSKPVRLQLSRKRGFNLQKLSRETNGLEAVNVARPSKWGNPFRVGSSHWRYCNTPREAVDEFTIWIKNAGGRSLLDQLPELAGKNLACWCADRPGVHCHADVLLALANPASGEGR